MQSLMSLSGDTFFYSLSVRVDHVNSRTTASQQGGPCPDSAVVAVVIIGVLEHSRDARSVSPGSTYLSKFTIGLTNKGYLCRSQLVARKMRTRDMAEERVSMDGTSVEARAGVWLLADRNSRRHALCMQGRVSRSYGEGVSVLQHTAQRLPVFACD